GRTGCAGASDAAATRLEALGDLDLRPGAVALVRDALHLPGVIALARLSGGELGLRVRLVDLLGRDRLVRQERQAVVDHLREPAVEEVRTLAPSGERQPEFARAQLADDGRTLVEEPHLTVPHRGDGGGNLLIEEAGFGGDDSAAEGLGHGRLQVRARKGGV